MTDTRNHVLDAILGDDHTADFPDPIYAALFTAAPILPAVATEPTAINGYARVALDNDNVTWDVASGGLKDNLIQILWPEATGSWGTITHVGLVDVATIGSGWCVLAKVLNTARAVGIGDQPRLNIGALQLQCSIVIT